MNRPGSNGDSIPCKDQRRRWYAAVARAREQRIDQHRATVLAGQICAWRQTDEIRAFCQTLLSFRV